MIENKVQALKLFLDIDDNDIEDISWTDSLDLEVNIHLS